MKKEVISEEVRSVRNNNPGNLRAVGSAAQKKLTQPGYVLDRAIGFDKDGFAIFPDKEVGYAAMQRQIRIDAGRGMTGAQMINKYAPSTDRTRLGKKYPNDPNSYINNVFTKAGIDPNKPIDPKDLDTIQRRMIAQEGGKRASDVYSRVGIGADSSNDAMLANQGKKSENEKTEDEKANELKALMQANINAFKQRFNNNLDLARRIDQNDPAAQAEFRSKFGGIGDEYRRAMSEDSTVRFKDFRRKIYQHNTHDNQLSEAAFLPIVAGLGGAALAFRERGRIAKALGSTSGADADDAGHEYITKPWGPGTGATIDYYQYGGINPQTGERQGGYFMGKRTYEDLYDQTPDRIIDKRSGDLIWDRKLTGTMRHPTHKEYLNMYVKEREGYINRTTGLPLTGPGSPYYHETKRGENAKTQDFATWKRKMQYTKDGTYLPLRSYYFHKDHYNNKNLKALPPFVGEPVHPDTPKWNAEADKRNIFQKFFKIRVDDKTSDKNADEPSDMNNNKIDAIASADLFNTNFNSILRSAGKMSENTMIGFKNLRQKIQESIVNLDETNDQLMEAKEKSLSLSAKAKKFGVSLSTLKTVFRRGMAAWNSGHRPGTTPQQWGHARVNSYLRKGKTYHTADKDLRK